ncbi:uncharacterized protein LOC135995844 isoform X3 [Caloenas nicobarica]|uniref:uncharacterized protein LOC135995844 isoform X3 n=1 Tax=Caloenas nicobarica TaxID=187106 RepID=UPI0032B773C9
MPRCGCLADNKQHKQALCNQLPILRNPQELHIFETSPTLSGLAEVCMWLLEQRTDPCPKQASCGMDNGNLQDEWTSQKRWGEADRRYWRKTQEKGHPSVFWIGRVSRSEEQEMQLHGGSTSSPATQVQVVTSVFTSIFGTVKVALGRKGNLFPAAAAQGAVNAATTADVHHFRGILVKIWNSSNQLRSL